MTWILLSCSVNPSDPKRQRGILKNRSKYHGTDQITKYISSKRAVAGSSATLSLSDSVAGIQTHKLPQCQLHCPRSTPGRSNGPGAVTAAAGQNGPTSGATESLSCPSDA